MTTKKLIHYESIHSKISWKYTYLLENNFTDLNVKDVEIELNHCYGTNQYIMRFIEMLKHKIIRFLPELNHVKIILGVFDKNNVLHRVMIGVYNFLCNMLKRDTTKNHYKTIITIIEYKDNIVFMGTLSFDGID